MSILGVSCAFVLGALLGPSGAVSGVVPFRCSHPCAAMAESENVSSLAAFALPQFGNLDTPSLKGDFSRLSEQHLLLFVPSVIQLRADTFLSGPLIISGSWLGSSLCGFLESEMDGTGSIFESNHGNGKRASLKDQSLLLGAMMKMLTSPQVGIAAMRQRGSCIIVYTSVAAQALELSAAALEGGLSLSSSATTLGTRSLFFSRISLPVSLWWGSKPRGSLEAAQAVEIAVAALEISLSLPSVFSNDTGDMVSLLLKDFVAGLFWVFLLGLGVLLTLEGNRCSGDGAARCVLLTLRARGLLHGGHVLGLRVLFRWDITSMSQRGVRESFEDALAFAMMTPRLSAALHVVAEFVEVWQQAAAARGCHIAFWAKATPRVDVVTSPILWAQLLPGVVCGLETWTMLGKKREKRKRRKM